MQQKPKRIHFIAIGGSVMHNLAIALHQAGHFITGSDDEIFEPSKGELLRHNILPEKEGWFPDKISPSTDLVVLGMHARKDNPELLKAQQLGVHVMSFPEYIYEHSRDKQRIVIAGSHGKTTITAIVIHVLNYFNRKFDYVVGAKVNNLERTVKLSDAPIIVIEGDEYLSSPLDPTPKFLRYQHHIGLISGISWDHANVFPKEEDYVAQFDRFSDQTPKAGILIYCEQDAMAMMIGKKERADVQSISYKSHPYSEENHQFYLTHGNEKVPTRLIGSHNLQNLNAAKELLKKIGITPKQFYEAVPSFQGAAGRLEKIAENATAAAYKDFAHAPSKVKATVKALKEAYPERELFACLELYTFSSLNKTYLPQYKNTLSGATKSVIYFNPEKVAAKNLAPISEADVRNAFGSNDIIVFNDPVKLQEHLHQQSWKNKNLLMMSSGTFGGINLSQLATKLFT